MMVLGQYREVLDYWLVLGGTGSVEGGTRSVKGNKGRTYLGVRLKRSEIGQFSGF